MIPIQAEALREALREAYRSGYAAGYAGGRVAEMADKPYDAEVPWEKEKDA